MDGFVHVINLFGVRDKRSHHDVRRDNTPVSRLTAGKISTAYRNAQGFKLSPISMCQQTEQETPHEPLEVTGIRPVFEFVLRDQCVGPG